jgi:hypothetical protein
LLCLKVGRVGANAGAMGGVARRAAEMHSSS